MVRDTQNDHVRRINELFADAKRRSSSSEPPKYVDIELINKKCNIHRGLTPVSSTGRRGSIGSNYSGSNNINNNNNTDYYYNSLPRNRKNLYSSQTIPTAATLSSDDDATAAESFLKDIARRQSISEGYHQDLQHKQIHDTLESLSGDKYRKRTPWNSNFKKNIEHPSAFPSLLRSSKQTTPVPPRQKDSIANQVAAEVINATAAALRDNIGEYETPPPSYSSARRSSINSLKNGTNTNGTSNTLKSTKRPSFGSTNSNIYSRRDSAVSLKSAPGSKRNSVDRADSVGRTFGGNGNTSRRGSTSYDSTYGSLPRRGSTSYEPYYDSLPRKKSDTKYTSTGSLTRKPSEPRDYVATTKIITTTTKPGPNGTPVTRHSILRKSSSPNTIDESESSGESRTTLTKENLTRHVRILEDAELLEHERKHQELLDRDIFQEFRNSNRFDNRFSADSLDLRRNSIDLIEKDIMENLTMNESDYERKIHPGNIICDSTTSCTDISSNRDYYNIPKNNKYSGSRSRCSTSTTNAQSLTVNDCNNNNNNNNNSNSKCNFEIQCNQNGVRKFNGSNNTNNNNYHNSKKGNRIDCQIPIPTNTNIVNKKNKKNLLVSRSVDDLRFEDHLFNYDSSDPLKFKSGYITTNNNNNNNNNGSLNMNRNNSNMQQQQQLQQNRSLNHQKPSYNHNYQKQKSSLYQIKNKHYSMDNLLTAVNQHFVEVNNNSYQTDTDRPQFVAVTSLDECQAVRCAEFHPHGKIYAVGSNSKTFRILEYPSLTDIREDHTTYQPTLLYEKPKYHKGSIYCMDWSPDGELIATGSNDKTIKLMRYNEVNKQLEGREVELTMHDGTIRDVCFIEDTTNKASLLISGGAGDNKIYVTDCGTATPFQALSGHGGHVLSLYNWGGAMFVSGSHDKTIRFWDLRTRQCVNTITPSTTAGLRQGSAVNAVSVDPSGRLLVSGHEDSSCVLYDIRGNRPIQCFKPHTADIRSIRFSPSAYYLLTAGYDKKLMLTDLQGDLTLQLPSVVVAHHADKVISGRWHPSDFSFLSTSADKTCVLWALSSKQ